MDKLLSLYKIYFSKNQMICPDKVNGKFPEDSSEVIYEVAVLL